MDIATILGLIIGVGVLMLAIIGAGESLELFCDPPAAMIVFGGSIAALLVGYPLKHILGLPKIMKKTLFAKKTSPEKLIKDLVSYAEIARRDGILALENMTNEIEDEFVIRGIQMAVDGTDPEVIENILVSEVSALQERHKVGKQMFEALARYGPGFGMTGTLIGLVIMLYNMQDPSRIGPGMAVGMIATFYGAVSANCVFGPLAEKLSIRSREELLMKEIVIRGVMAIQSGDNPRVVEQKLRTFLPAGPREDSESGRKAA